MAFNINKTNPREEAEVGTEFELVHPVSGKPLDGFIKVRGAISSVVEDFGIKQYEERELKKKLSKSKKKVETEDDTLSIKELLDLSFKNAAVRVISWRGIELGAPGVETPCTPENVEKLLKEQPWVRQQIIDASDSVGNFTEN